MTKMSDLPWDLTEEVLSKLPVKSMKTVRSTCKKWNTLSKDQSFTKKHFAEAEKKKDMKEFQVVMMLEERVFLMSVNLQNPSIECISKLISLEDADPVDISKIFHCDGLFLCISHGNNNNNNNNSKLVVWNPYSGQTRWIQPRNSYNRWDSYALGYEMKNNTRRDHKVLRFVDDYDARAKLRTCEFELYNLNSNSWKVFDFKNRDWNIEFYRHGFSLEGNTYWYAQEKTPLDGPEEISDLPDFLLCFDFTKERFGPRLPLPFHSFYGDTVTLSTVKEEQLAVLFQKFNAPTHIVKIWISSKIEPNAVSWIKFLEIDMKPLIGFQFDDTGGSFFIDEKEKVAVVLQEGPDIAKPTRNIAYIIGNMGYFRQVDLGESRDECCYPLVCSYVPSSVQITL